MLPENSSRTAPRGPGRPFRPGESGNPGGRPKGIAALVRDQTADGQELVVFMLAILRNPRRPPALRMQAATWLADRGFGRPVQQLDATMALDVDASDSGCSVCAAQERARVAIRANLTDEDLDRVARALLGPD
jgi:hypothetical protein